MATVSWVGAGGPLAPFADGYRAELTRLGFTPNSVVTHLVRGKGRGEDRLPLLTEVGEAVAAYLRDERPQSESRKLFLTRTAPVQGLHPCSIGHVVHRACERTGRAPVGPHRLRHALATELLRQGAALAHISQVLRHHLLNWPKYRSTTQCLDLFAWLYLAHL